MRHLTTDSVEFSIEAKKDIVAILKALPESDRLFYDRLSSHLCSLMCSPEAAKANTKIYIADFDEKSIVNVSKISIKFRYLLIKNTPRKITLQIINITIKN